MSDEITHHFPQGDVRAYLTQLEERVSLVEDQLERKLMETQPIWSQFGNEMALVLRPGWKRFKQGWRRLKRGWRR
jgi:hypothetical protein